MRLFVLLSLIVLMLSVPVLAGEKDQVKKINPDQIGLNVLAGISTFTFDGKIKVFEAPFAAGVQWTSIEKRIDAGIYLAPVVDEGGDVSNSSLSIMPFFNIYQKFGLGLGYKFWLSGQGLAKPKEETLFLSVNFSLLQ